MISIPFVWGRVLSDETRGISPDTPAVERIQAKWLRGLLLTRIGVLYSTAVADLLRMHLTMPLGCVRLQCESLALVKLMSEDPAVAHQWMGIQTDQEGKAFFRRYQGRLKAILVGYALAETYDQTSGVALHSRFIGVACGYRTARRQDGRRIIQSESILAQEFDGENPDTFMVQVFNILHIQARILARLSDAAPEINDPLLLETRLPQFIARVDSLFRHFGEHMKQRHPNIARLMEKGH